MVYKENGITRTIKAQSKEIAEAEFTWNKNCELSYILVRAQNNFSRTEKDPAYVYPYIYIKGRESKEWVQNEFLTVNTNNIAYLNAEDYGYLSFIKTDNNLSSLVEFGVYNTKNYAE